MELNLQVKRPAVRYHGSKFRLAKWIVGFFPAHRIYCEPFAGGAGVLLRKEASEVEVYNDLDSDVVNYFRVLREPELRGRLAEGMALTPFAREEYRDCFEPTEDPVERARRFAARAYMGFGSHSHNIENSNNGFRVVRGDGRSPRLHTYASEWMGMPAEMLSLGERLRPVVIEQLCAFDCIPRYDGPESLFYVDPPYVRSSRKDDCKGYAHEFSDHEHVKLAWLLGQVKGKVVLSGYDTGLYRDLYASWRREEKAVMANGQWGAVERLEVIWLNF